MLCQAPLALLDRGMSGRGGLARVRLEKGDSRRGREPVNRSNVGRTTKFNAKNHVSGPGHELQLREDEDEGGEGRDDSQRYEALWSAVRR